MNNSDPVFSVIIPTYQRAAVIEECVRSVLDQSFTNFEVIIIDDGSTDDTAQILKPLSETDYRVKYLYQENAERSNARNHGIRVSLGEYICFLDSDDLLLPEHLQLFYNRLKELDFPVALLYCNSMNEDNSRSHIRPESEQENPLELIMLHSIGAQQTCIHRSILVEHQFDPKIRIGEDRELWFRITKDYPMIYSDQRTTKIRDLGDRSVDITNTWAYKENIAHINHLRKQDSSGRIPHWILKSMYSTAHYKLALCYFRSNKRVLAFGQLLLSIFKWPKHKYRYKIILMMNILGLRWLLPERLRDAY